tara:strand:- start:3 stop:368 length:366 start_codon:yes stop_codon:yes gene_type:complete
MLDQGKKFEAHAQVFLLGQGLQLVQANYHCAWGEIDLVMTQGNYLVFIEVRQRRPSRYLDAAASVGHTKQQKIIKSAHLFLRQHRQFANMICRFDIVAYDCDAGSIAGATPKWLRSAFGLD